MRIVSLASGSAGNACLVESGETAVLIDCGINFKTLKARLAAANGGAAYDLSRIAAVLVTHNHGDHVSGLRVLLNKCPDLPVYANAMTAETVVCQEKVDENSFVCFENGQDFRVGGIAASPFSIPHDASDPVGYLIRADGKTYFHGTDIGTPLDSIGLKLAEADVATLESNHDPVMLRASERAICLKQRIWGPRGHLSNDQAADLVRRFAASRLRGLALGHLSRECNAPHLAERAMREALSDIGRADVALAVLAQDAPVEILTA